MLIVYNQTDMLTIRIPVGIERRLEKLAKRTGRTKAFYVRDALLRHLEDLEDIHVADLTIQRINERKEHTIPLRNVLKRYGSRL